MKTALSLLLAGMAFAQTAPKQEKSAFDKATLEAYLRNLELYLPSVQAKIDDAQPSKEMPGFFDVWVHWVAPNNATKDELVYVSKDGKTIFQGSVYQVNRNPFQPNLDKIHTDLQPSFGARGGPVSLVMFSDFECPMCKAEAAILRQNVEKSFPDKVRVYFIDNPLDSIHTWAHTAADAGRCVYKQNPQKFWDYFDWVYDQQENIGLDNFSSKLQQFATQKGIDGVALGHCVETKASEADVQREMAMGKALQINATPTLFINGRRLEGELPWQTLDTLIKMELDHQAQEAQAADKCCEAGPQKVVK
ncbi:MAG TPA: thioredoxin domain-containing protein [Bryobacteraceae bacterium]|nr:thioredoxin domain-containing protein [Bryobacteraceae bacterium]